MAQLLILLMQAATLALVICPGTAFAHAELARAEPAVDAIVASSPSRVTLWFTEEPELRYSDIQVVDRTGRRLDRGDVRGDPADRLAFSVGVPQLAPGSYGVVWRALSAVDGHTTQGSFTFTVGLDQVPTEVAVGPVQSSSTATPDRVIVRLLTYVGYAGFLGTMPFLWLIARPAFRQAPGLRPTLDALVRENRRVALFALGLTLIAAVAGLTLQAANAAGTSVAGVFGGPIVSVALGTRYGVLWWVRIGLILAVGALLLLPESPRPPAFVGPLAAGIGSAALLAHALASHGAAASGSALAPVVTDTLHLVALTFWVGGLIHLAVALRILARAEPRSQATAVVAALIPRFSTIAAGAVIALALTGLYQSWLLVGSLPALLGTAYGRVLLLKLVLVAILLAPAAINLLLLRPRLARAVEHGADGSATVRALRRTVATELAVAIVVLSVVGALTNLQPARDAEAAQGIQATASDEGVRATLQVQPGIAGPNRFSVRLTDRDGRPIADAEKVALRFTMLAMDMGETELTTLPRGDGLYVGQGGPLVMEGPWRIEAIVRRPGTDDARPRFQIDVRSPAVAGSRATAPPLAEGDVLLGIELLLLGVGALGLAFWLAPRNLRRVRQVIPIGAAAVLAGSLIAGGGFATLSAQGATRNPVAPTRESVSRGHDIYVERCTMCHGEEGRGDGPFGLGLNPKPADFRVHLAAGHTDAQLFDWISHGVPGTAMPHFQDELSETDRWHVINYIKASFGPGAAPTTARPREASRGDAP
jgi:copper transport protein